MEMQSGQEMSRNETHSLRIERREQFLSLDKQLWAIEDNFLVYSLFINKRFNCFNVIIRFVC